MTVLVTVLLASSLSASHTLAATAMEPDSVHHPRPAQPTWHASWATAHDSADTTLNDQTVRTIVHLTRAGTSLRVSFAQDVATTPVDVTHVVIGRRDGERGMKVGTTRQVKFAGQPSFELAPGERITSDPIRLPVRAQEDIVVDVAFSGQATPSAHRSAYQDNYLNAPGAGDDSGEPAGTSFTQTTSSFLLLSTVDVLTADSAATIAVVGGSVVDGQGSRQTGPMGSGAAAPVNSRWSDVLARRLFHRAGSSTSAAGVVNAGISANTAARECATSTSPTGNVQDRYQHDVLDLAGLTHVIVYAGTNDVGMPLCSAEQIIAAYQDLAERTHERGVRIIFATITPRLTYTPIQNDVRDTVNQWLMAGGNCTGACDGVVDFDRAVAWSAYPDAIDPALDSGDTVHPNADGYRLIGRTIPLRLFKSAHSRPAPR